MKRQPRAAYALLVVLVALTLAAVALIELSTRTWQAQTNALERLRSLQTRWGRITCGRAALLQAPAVMEAMEQQLQATTGAGPSSREFPVVLRESLALGGQLFQLVVADEQAKLNLNAVQRWGRPGALAQTLRQCVPPAVMRSLRNLPPSNTPVTLGSWGDVFDLTQFRSGSMDERLLVEVTQAITVWGSGELNVRRASRKSLEWTCKAVVTDGLARRIVEKRDETPYLDTESLLRQTVLNDEDRNQLEEVLGDSSQTFSVWVQYTTGKRQCQQLQIVTSDANGRRQVESFCLE